MLSSRKGYRGMPIPDRHSTIQMVAAMPTQHKTIAAYAITGGYMLQHQKSKFDTDRTDLCQYCEKDVDSHTHRVLECEFTESARVNFPTATEYFAELDPIHVTCPIMYRDPAWELHRQIWHSMDETPLALPDFAMSQPVYTDGTCQLPDSPSWRYAANAAVCFRPNAPDLRQLQQLSVEESLLQGFHVIAVGLLQGSQSIARAELNIVVRLLEARHPGPIITDSQYVINMSHVIAAHPQWQALHARPNFDLLYRWHRVHWEHQHRAQLTKVKSHQATTKHTNLELLAQILGNAAADEAARQACSNLAKQQHTDLQTQYKDTKTHHQMLLQQFHMRYDMGIMCMHFDRPEVCLHNGGDPTKFLQQMKNFSLADQGLQFDISSVTETVIPASRWGTIFSDLLAQWLGTLRWGPTDNGHPPIGISWIELIFNFLYTAQVEIPVNTAPYKKESR